MLDKGGTEVQDVERPRHQSHLITFIHIHQLTKRDVTPCIISTANYTLPGTGPLLTTCMPNEAGRVATRGYIA
jgi:hypothetical protein